LLPSADKKVFQTDLLMLSNGKASRSEAVALLVLLNTVFKGLIEVNRTIPNATGLPEADELRLFVANGGPTLLDEYAPRLVDWLPPANLLHFVVVISLLANAMTLWHRFRLWRIDSARCQLEEQILDLFGHRYTLAEIALLEVAPGDFKPPERALLNGLIHETQRLRERIRRQAASLIVPMGAELYYRYQESLLYTQLQALRQFRERRQAMDDGR
jgi:hypothetical protein